MAIVTLINQDNMNEVVRLYDRPLTLGRHPDNDVVVADDLASRFHCVVEPIEGANGAYRVRDLGSRNGTKVNKEKIKSCDLQVNDVIGIGAKRYIVKVMSPEVIAAHTDLAPKAPRAAETLHGALDEFNGGGNEGGGQAAARPRGISLRNMDGTAASAPGTAPEPTPAAPQGRKPARQAKAPRLTGVTLPRWADVLREIVEVLPPKSSADIPITMINARGESTEALAGNSAGSVATRLVLLAATKARATDIHIEPKGDAYGIRIRVDGQMVRLSDIPNEVGVLVLGIVRAACLMKSAARDAVQDGHFSSRVQERRVDYRSSFTPSVHGQKLVVRVLDELNAPHSLREMNLAPYMLERLSAVCEQTQGMILVCGPTGSGKTTTLYNAMRSIDREHRNVITIEDPVEYHLEGVTQIPADNDRGHSFGELLRSVLRQDPDVILVGEIRDDETARTGMRAAMTGHLVFSTVHAKDTIGAVFRLLDLGVEPYLVANSLDLVLAQRLLRVLCPECKQPTTLKPGQANRMGRYAQGVSKVYTPVGCKKCLNTGFWGRQAGFEMLSFTDELRDVVLNNPTIHSMKQIIEQGLFTSLAQSGWKFVCEGVTSIEEVDRVMGS
ncbi:MAG: Flp pilus assembly complex ATPase component TadA [Phycisphaeraceae bacterium]|nr:Flp pilus assembly complex ATPase component TadA [Phycisphaeraceae bacterium]